MKLKKIGIGFLIIICTIIILCTVSYFVVSAKNNKIERKIEQSQTKLDFSIEEINQDIDFFEDFLQRIHPAEIPSFPLGDIKTEIQDLRKSINRSTNQITLYRHFAPVVHALNDEHTMLYPPKPLIEGHYKNNGKFFPFLVQFIGDKLYIKKNLSDDKSIKNGVEILDINKISAQALRKELMNYYSGRRDEQKISKLENRFHEALFLLHGFDNKFELTIYDQNTETTNKHVVYGKARSNPNDETKAFFYKTVSPNTILFTYNAFEDKDNIFDDFLKDMFKKAKEQKISNLIIDLRQNEGGATTLGDEILKYLTSNSFQQLTSFKANITKELKDELISYAPAFVRWFPLQYFHPWLRPLWTGKEGDTIVVPFSPVKPKDNPLLFSGNVYVLIGPVSMSSSSLFAATIQKYKIGKLIGEPAGGYATCYGTVVNVYLPNTGLRIMMPTSVIYGNSTGLIEPDYIISQTEQDLLKNKDTVLEFTLKLIQNAK